jgi:transposase
MDLTDQLWMIIEPLFEEKRRPPSSEQRQHHHGLVDVGHSHVVLDKVR